MKLLKKLGYFVGKKNAQGFPVRHDEYGKEVNVPAIANYDWSDVVNPITRKQVIKWVADLRSGKFKQTKNNLRLIKNGETCHCCLGVLAEINDQLVVDYDDVLFLNYRGSVATLSVSDPDDDFDRDHYLPLALQRAYYELNDAQGWTFAEIAAQIEKDFGLV